MTQPYWSKVGRIANVIALVCLAGLVGMIFISNAENGELSFWIMLALFVIFCVAVLVRFLRSISEDMGLTRD